MRILLLVLFTVTGCLEDRSSLEAEARGFLHALGYQVVGVSCTDRDSDGDGYASCTATVRDSPEPIAVECASRWSFTSGCRLQKLNVRQ